jgi:hypothetical protein
MWYEEDEGVCFVCEEAFLFFLVVDWEIRGIFLNLL